MGIRFPCPNGHKLNVKTFLAGKRGVCPQCGAKFVIPVLLEGVDFDAEPSADPGRSHSIEITAPVVGQATSAVESPSIIISVADAVETSARPAHNSAVATPSTGFGNDIPLSFAATASVPTPAATNPAEAPVQTQIVARRGLSRQNQILLSMALFVLAIALAVVLILVLKRDLNQTPVEQPDATAAPSVAK